MKKQLLAILPITFVVSLMACSQPAENETKLNVALSEEDDESILAESLYCAGSTRVLSEISATKYPVLAQWKDTFAEIEMTALKKANSMKGEDGAAIERRLGVIVKQTKELIASIEQDQEPRKINELVTQTVGQCAQFIADKEVKEIP
jgi:hypothetical protein